MATAEATATAPGTAPPSPLRAGAIRAALALVPVVAAFVVGAIVLAATGWDPLSVYRLMAREA